MGGSILRLEMEMANLQPQCEPGGGACTVRIEESSADPGASISARPGLHSRGCIAPAMKPVLTRIWDVGTAARLARQARGRTGPCAKLHGARWGLAGLTWRKRLRESRLAESGGSVNACSARIDIYNRSRVHFCATRRRTGRHRRSLLSSAPAAARPLHGIPSPLGDNIDTPACTTAQRRRLDRVPTEDAEAARRLRGGRCHVSAGQPA